MDLNSKTRSKKYDRVMPRVFNRSSIKSSSFVTRHETPSSVRLSAKPSVSNASASVYSELPTVLNDYIPESVCDKPKRTVVVKPRKTLKSLDPALSPPRPPPRIFPRHQYLRKRPPNVRAETSAPSVLTHDPGKWSDTHVRQCYSSRSHSKLKDLKTEIQMYHETDKLMKLRSRLYKNCGVVLDDVGLPAEDKAVQVECADNVKNQEEYIERRQEEMSSSYAELQNVTLTMRKRANLENSVASTSSNLADTMDIKIEESPGPSKKPRLSESEPGSYLEIEAQSYQATDDEECELFGKLLTCKLKNVDRKNRLIIMNKIDNYMHRRMMNKMANREGPSSPCPSISLTDDENYDESVNIKTEPDPLYE